MPGRIVIPDDEEMIAELLRQLRRHRSTLATQVPQPAKDSFTVAATPATDYPLTAIPYKSDLGSSVILTWNGVTQVEGPDYSVDYDTGVVTLDSSLVAFLTVDDVLYAEYETTGELVAATLPAEGDFTDPSGFRVYSGVDVPTLGLTFTPTPGALMIVSAHWGLTVLDGTGVSIGDTWGLTWTKLDEAIAQNSGNPSSTGCTIFAATAPSTPTAGTLTVTFPAPHASAAVIEEIEIVDCAPSGDSATNTGLDVGSLTVTLGSAPSAAQGAVAAWTNWPHKVMGFDSDYTVIDEGNNSGGGGPYFQEIRHGLAVNLTGPDATATVTNTTGTADTAGVLVTLDPI